jgi:DNA polymerase V
MKKQINEKINLTFFQSNISSSKMIPFFGNYIKAGFPSPADDYIENRLDLNELLIKHPAATFFVRVEGESMENALIRSGDVLVVDRSLSPAHGKIVVAVLNGEFTVKRIAMCGKNISLLSENDSFPAIEITEDVDFQIWGVVTHIIHQAK